MRVVYRGPGDYVELDGIRISRGKPQELNAEQIERLKASDPQAQVDVLIEKGHHDAGTV